MKKIYLGLAMFFSVLQLMACSDSDSDVVSGKSDEFTETTSVGRVMCCLKRC